MKIELLKPWMGVQPGTKDDPVILDIVDGGPGVKGQASLMIERGTAKKVVNPRQKRKQQQGAKNRAVRSAPVNK